MLFRFKMSGVGLIKDFKSTDIVNAFILNALCQSLIVVVSIVVNSETAKMKPDYNSKYDTQKNTWYSVLITLFTSFIVANLIYWLLYFIFGYGGGMLMETH